MVTFDGKKNFGYSTVLTPPSSGGNTSTQLTVQSGNGSLFPSPSTAEYNLVVWAAGVNPTVSNATIVRVSGLSGDKFTFIRTQEGSNDRVIIAGDQVALAITAKTLTDIQTAFNNLNFYNVMDYGAVGNNSTDDTAAIQAAINAANLAGGGTVLYPNLEFKLTGALTSYTSVRHLGMASEATILNQTSTTADIFDTNDASSIWIENIVLLGPGSGSGSGMFLTWTGAGNIPYAIFKHVFVKNFGTDGINIATPIVSCFDTVECKSNGRYGFNLVQGGTSTTFRNTYAHSNTTAGYRFFGSAYINLDGTAADTNGIGYLIDGCNGVTMNSAGFEGSTGAAGIKINNSSSVVINGLSCFGNSSIGIWVTGSSQDIIINGATELSPSGSPTAFVQVDSGCSVTVCGIKNITANSYATGTTTVLNDGSGDMLIAGSVNIGGSSLTSRLTLPAGTATAHTSPLKFTSGTNLTSPEAGAYEFDGSFLYITDSVPTRHQITTNDNTQTLTNKTISGASNTLTLTSGNITSGLGYTPVNKAGDTMSANSTLVIAAGTTSNPGIKISSGTNTTVAQSGAIEYDGTSFYVSDNTPTRHTVTTIDQTQTLTGKSISGSSNTLTNIPGGNITSSSITGASIASYFDNRQNNSSNVTETASHLQTGWGVAVIGANSHVNVTVTFPVSFTNLPLVVCTFGGDNAASTTYGSGSNNVKGAVCCKATDITTSNFVCWIHSADGTSWSAGNTVFFQWIAIGV